ncbi:MAG TPA: hypothetical protein VMI73_05215 [Trebonia sp.]|nr:hypothetical protein [Trebonia sp.]
MATVCCAKARPEAGALLPADAELAGAELAGALLAAVLLAGVLLAAALLAGVLLAGVLGVEELPELQAASSAAAVTAIPDVSQYFRLSVIAIYLRRIPSLG